MKTKTPGVFRAMAVLLVLLMVLSMLPVSAFAAYDFDEIPEEMLDNVFLDALEYIGYDVQGQIDDQNIYKDYGSSATAYGSDIGYTLNDPATGLETTGTGSNKVPDLATFKSKKFCCASYVGYVYFNYLPNIKGIDTSGFVRPDNPVLAASWAEAAEKWVAQGKASKISYSQTDETFTPDEEIPIGSLLTFWNENEGRISHVAIYAGAYNGKHFVTHIGNSRGPEITTVEGLMKSGVTLKVEDIFDVPEFYEDYGSITVEKKGPNGEKLAGAKFKLTNLDTDEWWFLTTDSTGTASKSDLPLGNYSIQETVPPTGYVLDSTVKYFELTTDTPNFTYTAVNTRAKGSIVTVKYNADASARIPGAVFGCLSSSGQRIYVYDADSGSITFTDPYTGTSVTATADGSGNGAATFSNLPTGTYVVYEAKAPNGYVWSNHKVTVVLSENGQTERPYVPADGNYTAAYLDASGNPYKPFTNTLAVGNIQVWKYNADASARVNGAVFACKVQGKDEYVYIYDADSGSVTFTDPTNGRTVTAYADGDANGSAYLAGLPLDTYLIYEAKAPAGYNRTTLVDTVVLSTHGQIEYIREPISTESWTDAFLDANGDPYKLFTNTLSVGAIQVWKYNADASGRLTGAVFGCKVQGKDEYFYVYDADSGSVTFTDPTNGRTVTAYADGDANGSAYFAGLPLDTYLIYEAKAPAGYNRTTLVDTVVLSTHGQIEYIREPISTESWTDAFLDANGDPYKLFTNTRAVGSIVAVKYDTDGTTWLPGAVFGVVSKTTGQRFYVYDATSGSVTFTDPYTGTSVTVTADGNGNGVVTFTNLPTDTYVVYEAKAPEGYVWSSHKVTVELTANGQLERLYTPADGNYTDAYLDADGVKYELFKNTRAKGAIQVVKYDADDMRWLPGVVFGVVSKTTGERFYVYDADSGSVTFTDPYTGTSVTAVADGSGNGVATFTNLPTDTYVVYEAKAPDGYVWSSLKVTVELTANGQLERLYTPSDGNYTDANLDANGVKYELFTNKKETGSIIVQKRDKDDLKLVPGAVFGCYNTATGDVFYRFDAAAGESITFTDPNTGEEITCTGDGAANGGVTFSDLPHGEYLIRELVAPADYELGEGDGITVTLSSAQPSYISYYDFLNEPHKGALEIIKDVVPAASATPENLAGWVFELYVNDSTFSGTYVENAVYRVKVTDSDGSVTFYDESAAELERIVDGDTVNLALSVTGDGLIYQWEISTDGGTTWNNADAPYGGPYASDETGRISVTGLSLGRYYVIELASDREGWVCDNEPKPVEIRYGAVATASFTNTLGGYGQIIKKTPNGGTREGWLFEVRDANGNEIEGSPFVTDANGSIDLGMLAPGTYEITEIGHESMTAAELRFWAMLDQSQNLTVSAGDTSSVVFRNKWLGRLIGKKVSVNSTVIGGWIFQIENTDGTVIDTVTTDENGEFTLDLDPGQYVVREIGHETIADLTYWVLDPAQTVTVTAGETVEVSFSNTLMGELAIQKEMTDDGPLEGWEFVIRDSEGYEIEGSPFVTDANGRIFTGLLEPGVYTVEEIIPDGSLYQCVGDNPKTIEVIAGQTAAVTFTNTLNPGSLTVNKVDGSSSQPLAGAVFLLEWLDGDTWTPVTFSETIIPGGCSNAKLVDGCLTSGEDGIVTFEGLHPGCEYRLTEVKAPEGYLLKADHIFVGKLPAGDFAVSHTVENDPVYVYPPSGSIGAPGLHSFAMACAAAALLLMVGIYFWLPRSRKYVIDVTDVDNNFTKRRNKQ